LPSLAKKEEAYLAEPTNDFLEMQAKVEAKEKEEVGGAKAGLGVDVG
jgi:hypothetical protein